MLPNDLKFGYLQAFRGRTICILTGENWGGLLGPAGGLILSLNEDTRLVMRAIGVVSHTACKDEFRRNLRSHSWSVFSSYY